MSPCFSLLTDTGNNTRNFLRNTQSIENKLKHSPGRLRKRLLLKTDEMIIYYNELIYELLITGLITVETALNIRIEIKKNLLDYSKN